MFVIFLKPRQQLTFKICSENQIVWNRFFITARRLEPQISKINSVPFFTDVLELDHIYSLESVDRNSLSSIQPYVSNDQITFPKY